MCRSVVTQKQPSLSLTFMVKKLGYVFPHSGEKWSRDAIKLGQSRVTGNPCHELGEHNLKYCMTRISTHKQAVTKVVRGTQPFNLSLYDGCQLEIHLSKVLSDEKRNVVDRRKGIESILLRFMSANQVLFPELELCDFPKIYQPA